VNNFIQNPDGTAKVTGVSYYLLFVALMLGTTVLYVVVAPFYRGKSYIGAGSTADVAERPPAS
jgi:hypothetical protein